MSDLISREAALELFAGNAAARTAIRALPKVTPQVVANISGGVLQGASSDHPVDIYTLDFEDVPCDEADDIIEVEGSRAILGQCSALIDPNFVREVVEAEAAPEEEDD